MDRVEPTRVDVESPQFLLELDVEELAGSCSRTISGGVHESDADSPMSHPRVDHDVFQIGVNQPIPQHVGKADETVVVSGDYPAKAESLALGYPVPLRLVLNAGLEGLGMKRMNLGVGERSPPDIADSDVA